jgi:hypothetical protein
MLRLPRRPRGHPPRAPMTDRHHEIRDGRRADGLTFRALGLGLLALLWLIVQSGRKPTRIAYPCQQAALGGVSLAFGLSLAPWLHPRGLRLLRRRARFVALGALLAALGFSGLSDSSAVRLIGKHAARAPADYRATVYVVEDAGGPEGDHHGGIDELVSCMGAAGLKLYRSSTTGPEAGPEGLIGADDVVLVKINQQWGERGGTNTDVLKGLIARILEHPDGFSGEVVVVENTQGMGRLDWPASNAEDHGQSAQAVVNHFAGLGRPVSAYLWDGIRNTSVAEYADGNAQDGYVVGPWIAETQMRVSYPKFRTAGGHYVSLKYGVWNPASQTYDGSRLRFLNVPVLKCHGAVYGVTASVKHHVGTMTTALATSTHSAVRNGGIGSFLSQVRMPDLNILDCIHVLAIPNAGPSCSYAQATRTDKLLASRDPVALDLWATVNILVPAILQKGYTSYPMQDPWNPASIFRTYLDRTAAELIEAGIPVTNDLGSITAHVCPAGAGVIETTGVVTGAYPNPFTSQTAIRFVPRRSGTVRLDIYDLTGRLRRSIAGRVRSGAAHEILWDGNDGGGRRLRPGTYYYRLTGAGEPVAGKTTMVR